MYIISDIKKYFLVLHIISMIILNTYELKNTFNKKNKDSSKLEKELKNIKNIEGLRDYTKILYDLVTLNIISLLSNLIPKYGIITRCYRKIKSKIRGQ
jgi:hypothetical protein